mgnify:CR=1 FL=1
MNTVLFGIIMATLTAVVVNLFKEETKNLIIKLFNKIKYLIYYFLSPSEHIKDFVRE